MQVLQGSLWQQMCAQTPDMVLADITPAERAKYDGHFAKVKRTGGWVDAKTARQFFAKAGLPVRRSPLIGQGQGRGYVQNILGSESGLESLSGRVRLAQLS